MVGRSQVQGQPGLHSSTLSPTHKNCARLFSGYVYWVYMKYKLILCLDLDPSWRYIIVYIQIFQNLKKSERLLVLNIQKRDAWPVAHLVMPSWKATVCCAGAVGQRSTEFERTFSNVFCYFASLLPDLRREVTLLLQSPAVKFITNPEFFTVLHANYVSACKCRESQAPSGPKTSFVQSFERLKRPEFNPHTEKIKRQFSPLVYSPSSHSPWIPQVRWLDFEMLLPL
jgi:hypothetical protein